MQFVTLREEAGGPTQTAVLGPRGWVTLASLQSVGLPDGWANDIQSLIAAGAEGVAQVQRALDATPDGATLAADLDALPLAPVVLRPAKILCVGLNYRKHAAESNMAVPSTPILFSKFANALAAYQDEVLIPPVTSQVDYEAELAIVIGGPARDLREDEALKAVFGYCAANDVSARDLQMRTSQWLIGKTCDRFLPLGPVLVTADEVGNPDALTIRSYVNGQLRQNSSTADMVFGVAQIVAYASQFFTLEPGDIICTGTPEGVAMGLPGTPWLQPGDEVVVEVEKLGRLRNRFV
ncbi:MAG: fumarylacetoacetate hydrolase family protein, partial [Caldilineaceae bacterium]